MVFAAVSFAQDSGDDVVIDTEEPGLDVEVGVEDTVVEQPPLVAVAPKVKATVLMRVGGGAAQSRARLKWVDKNLDADLDGTTLVSSGNAKLVEFSGWFYPVKGSWFILMATVAVESGNSKIHYSGPDYDLIDNKFINYGSANILGGIGHRYWFSKSKRFSCTHYVQGGPGGASLDIDGAAKDFILTGGEIKGGASIQYHYKPPIIFGGFLEFGYRAYFGSEYELSSRFENAVVDVDLSSGYIQLGLILGYDF